MDHVAVAEEPVAQGGDHVLLTIGLLLRHRLDDLGEPGGLGAIGPLDLPRGLDGLLDQELLDAVLRLEIGGPILEPQLECVGILAGQDEGPGGHAVLDGIEFGAALPFGRPRPGTPLRVFRVDLRPIGLRRGGRRVDRHGGRPREWLLRKSFPAR